MDKLFCHLCRFYTHHSTVFSSFASDAEFGTFNGATSRLKKHVARVRYQNSTFARIDYNRMKENETSCASMLNAQHMKLVQENCHYMTAVWKEARLSSLQGIWIRGHREDLGAIDSNPGNFLSILSILSDHDLVMHDGLNESTTAKYTHHSIQNELDELLRIWCVKKLLTRLALQSTSVCFVMKPEIHRKSSRCHSFSVIFALLANPLQLLSHSSLSFHVMV